MNAFKVLAIVGLAFLLTSCDLSQVPALNGGRLSKDDSKAIGAACRHAGRALEDCFTLNPKTHQAGVFEGWREMNDYMASNKLETVAPEIPPKQPKAKSEDPAVGEKALPGAKPSVHVEHDAATGQQAANMAGSGSARWSPRPGSASAPATAASASSSAVAAAPASGPVLEPVSEPAKAAAASSQAAAAPSTQASPPATQPKPRPWERRPQGAEPAAAKPDPKNHT